MMLSVRSAVLTIVLQALQMMLFAAFAAADKQSFCDQQQWSTTV
jgi:hypothetical protein